MPNFGVFCNKHLTIIGQGWGKYCDLSVASRSDMCRSWRLRKIVDLWDTDKMTIFCDNQVHHCFIIWSRNFFLIIVFKAICHFNERAIARRRKVWLHLHISIPARKFCLRAKVAPTTHFWGPDISRKGQCTNISLTCKREETVGKLRKWKCQFIWSWLGASLFIHNRGNLR